MILNGLLIWQETNGLDKLDCFGKIRIFAYAET